MIVTIHFLNPLYKIINLRAMKKYELQYKMKKAKPNDFNEISKAKILKRVTNSNTDEYLQSAEQFYKKANFKPEVNVPKCHNPQMDLNLSGIKGKHEANTPRTSRGTRVTPDTLKRSLEHDVSSNLEHWRKETFKYQEMAFALQRKNIELLNQNKQLKLELKLRNAQKPQTPKEPQNPQKELLTTRMSYQAKIQNLQKVIQSKFSRLKQLQQTVKMLASKGTESTCLTSTSAQ